VLLERLKGKSGEDYNDEQLRKQPITYRPDLSYAHLRGIAFLSDPTTPVVPASKPVLSRHLR
jgi:hypothetical protein